MSRFKYMSERRAWVWAAKDAKSSYCGLCGSLWDLFVTRRISEKMYYKMEGKIKNAYPTANLSQRYIWPLTDEGHAQRRAFALKQAALCTDGRLK